MKRSVKVPERAAIFLYVLAIVSLAYGLSPSSIAFAQPAEPPSPTATPEPSVEEVARQKDWNATMSHTPPPKHGCFSSTYPNTEWKEEPCVTGPVVPYPRAVGPKPDNVGGGTGFAAEAAGSISTAVGQFNKATVGISESGPTPPTDGSNVGGPIAPNQFSLQLNTNQFTTSVCTPPASSGLTASPNCKGWEQFIFSNTGHVKIQYWLLGYFDNRSSCTTDCCPSGWTAFKPTASSPGAAGCYRDSLHTPATPQTLTAQTLLNMSLIAKAASDQDSITVRTDLQHLFIRADDDSILNLASDNSWNVAEFNIFGDCCSSKASFSTGSTFDVIIDVGGPATCDATLAGFTAEMNSLTIVEPCCPYTTPPAPVSGGVTFTQSNVAGTKATCDAGPHCLPAGASCTVTGPGCCATYGQHECRNGVCAPVIPINTCNGKPRPPRQCGLGWNCCGTDGWVCGHCQ